MLKTPDESLQGSCGTTAKFSCPIPNALIDDRCPLPVRESVTAGVAGR
jgi:hypothetical protein